MIGKQEIEGHSLQVGVQLMFLPFKILFLCAKYSTIQFLNQIECVRQVQRRNLILLMHLFSQNFKFCYSKTTQLK